MRTWRCLAQGIVDDSGTKPGRSPSNQNNRFDTANELNGLLSSESSRGPFWSAEPNWRRGKDARGEAVHIPQRRPNQFIGNCGMSIPAKRISDDVVESDYPFRLFGTGSVGSQVLTGIPKLYHLRKNPAWRNRCAIWPFETGWAPPVAEKWLGDDIRLVLAEIYPSVRAPLEDDIKDRGQVRSMWHWARDLDQMDEFVGHFSRPINLSEEQDACVRQEEGWVLH